MDITIYTDGGCSGNPGPGGWGAILMYKDTKKAGFVMNFPKEEKSPI